jgi:hypothetical protein
MNALALRSRLEAIGTDLVSADRTGSDYLKRFVSSERVGVVLKILMLSAAESPVSASRREATVTGPR